MRATRKQIAALAEILRTHLGEIAARSGPVIDEHRQALDVVDAFVRGGKITKKEVDGLTRAISAQSNRFGVGSPPAEKAVYWVGGPIARLLKMALVGEDDTRQILTQIGYSIGSLHEVGWGEYAARAKTLHETALAKHADVSDEPLPEKKKRVSAKVAAREKALLAKTRDALPPLGRALLDRIGAERDAKLHGTRDELAALLAKHGFPAHDAALELEELFGGLLVPNGGGPRWREENQWGLAGAFGCLTLAASRARPLRDLVPVYYGAQDEIVFIDGSGRTYVLDMVGDTEPRAFAPDAPAMVTAVLAFQLLVGDGPWRKGGAQTAAVVGKGVASALHMTAVFESPGQTIWASADGVVQDMGCTTAVAFTDEAWRAMQDALAEGGPSVADLLMAARAGGDNELLAARDALCSAIAKATTFDDIEAIFKPALARSMIVGSRAKDDWGAVADALVARALTMESANDAARTVGFTFARSATTAGPSRFEAMRDPSKRRAGWAAACAAHLPLLRRWLADDAAERRLAGAYAVAWCGGPEDGDDGPPSITKERDDEAIATHLVARARAQDYDRVDAAISGARGALTRVCRAWARALRGQPLDADDVAVLLAQLEKPVALPVIWEWRDEYDAWAKSDAIAAGVLAIAKFAEPDDVVARILARAEKTKAPALRAKLLAPLARLAFEGRGRPVPRGGLVRDELDPLEERVIAAFAAGPPHAQRVNGVLAKDFLEAKTIDWRCVDVDGKKMHFARLLAAAAFGEIPAARARDAVVSGFPSDEAAELATSWSEPRAALDPHLALPEHRARARSVCLGILDEVEKEGFDVDALARGWEKSRKADVGILALAVLQRHAESMPADMLPLLERALSMKWWGDELFAALRALPEATRAAILHHAKPHVWGLRFFSLLLDEITIPKLVALAASMAESAGEIVTLVASGGARAAAVLDATAWDARAEPIVARIRAAMGNRR